MIVLLLAALVGLYFKVRPFEDPDPKPLPDAVETWQKDEALLSRLRTASLPPTPEAATEDWPQWRGPGRDGISRERFTPIPWTTEGPRTVWKVSGGPGHSSLSASGDRVVTMVQSGDEEVILCLARASGQELWRHAYAARFQETYGGLGPRSTPTIADGRVYAVGSTGRFHCLDAASGKVLWHHDLLAEFETPNQNYGMCSSPLIEGDLVIVLPGSAKGASVAAFDRRTGTLIWKALGDRSGYSSPVAATIGGQRQIVVVTGASIAGLSAAEGRLLWAFPRPNHEDCNISTPIVAGNYVFATAEYDLGCVLLEILPGTGGIFSTKPVYEHNRMRSKFSTPVLHQEHVYGFDKGLLVCLEFRTGKVLWKQRGFDQGSLILSEGRLIILGENGRLALAKANPRGYEELAACDLLKPKSWAPPCLSRQRLYLRDQEWIYCLDLGGGK